MANTFLDVARARIGCGLIRIVVLAVVVGVASVAPSAMAVTPAPRWAIEARATPTNLTPGSTGALVVLVTNTGGASTNGETVTITDTLPSGLTALSATLLDYPSEEFGTCEAAGATVTCTYHPEREEAGEFVPVPIPGANTNGMSVRIAVSVASGLTGPLMNTATVSGGDANSASATDPVMVGSQELPFAFNEPFAATAFDVDGALDTQAGGHPNAASTEFVLNSIAVANPYRENTQIVPAQPLKDAAVELPAGFVGNPQAAPTCPQHLVAPPGSGKACPAASVIGSVALLLEGASFWLVSELANSPSAPIKPLFNVTPEHGHPAQFAFVFLNQEATLYVNLVHTAAGYVARVSSPSITRLTGLIGVKVTIFGNPAVQDGGSTPSRAFFTNPSDCSQPGFTTTVHADSWPNPASLPAGSDGGTALAEADFSAPQWITAVSEAPPVTGCENLHFNPTLSFTPEPIHSQADEPTGYESVLRVPQNEDPDGLATPPLKNAVVTLPAGVAISPAAADGLLGCQETGSEGIELESTKPGHCPPASTVGSVKVVTPLLKEPLEGSVYVAQPACGGSGQPECSEEAAETGGVFALYLEVGSENSGVHLKLKGKVEVGGNGRHSRETGLQPGQIRTTFAEAPQQPFSELTLKFKDGPRAPLANPQTCGSFATTSELEPWSHQPAPGEAHGTPNATPLSPAFTITGCEDRFAPSFSAGTINPQAGAYSPFTLTFSRHDREQNLSGITVNMPPGLLGKIAGIPQCPEAQANAGTCPAVSRIGSATAAAGSGSHPFWQSGNVYLTGPYKGAPFGLSVVVPAKAGPFNLGNIVVRAAIGIDSHTAQINVASDPLPQSVDGVPLRVQTVNVTIDRAGFTFNPTNCSPLAVNGTLTSAQGAQAVVANRFQAANCAALPFKPSLKVSTQAKTSKTNGASLLFKIASGAGQANIAKVRFVFPKQLPARLTTLQKACTEAQFNANPAGCPAASVIGTAVAHTPVLNSPLAGPIYLVSHGGAAFPDAVVILQGEGVTVYLDGNTNIKKRVTSSTFNSVPDAPISTFEAKVPQGPHSAFATNIPAKAKGSLCGQALTMPTTITGQNGAVVSRNTKITVSGCPKHKKAKHKKAKRATHQDKAKGKKT